MYDDRSFDTARYDVQRIREEERRRAEQRVDQGVNEDVPVGMREKSLFKRDLHAAERKSVALPEAVGVVAVSDPHLPASRSRTARIASAS